MATDSERYEPSSSSRTGTPPDEFFARNSGMRLWPAKMSTSSSETRCPFLPRRCERGADLAPLHDCKASQDGPFQSLPNTVGRVLLPIIDNPICHTGPYFARLNRGKSCTIELLAEIPIAANSLPALQRNKHQLKYRKHRVRPEPGHKTYKGKYLFPWVMAKAFRLPKPVSYRHPSGAVIWVTLTDDVAHALTRQIRRHDAACGVPVLSRRRPYAQHRRLPRAGL